MNAKKISNLFAATVFTCSMIAAPVMAAPNTAGLEEQKLTAESQISGLQSQLTMLMSKSAELSNQLIAKGEDVIQAEEQLKQAQEREQKQYEDMKLRIKYMYEEGDGTAAERVFSSGNISDMLSQAEYVQKVHLYDRDRLNEYVETVAEVENLKNTLEKEQAKLESLHTEMESQKSEMNVTLEAKRSEVVSFGEQIQVAAKAAVQEEAGADSTVKDTGNAISNIESDNAGIADIDSFTTTNTPMAETQDTPSENDGEGNLSAAQAIVNAAWTQIGVPYEYGGSTPYVGLDCSGLTQWCHKQAGISIGRTDYQQMAGGKVVTNPLPGDIAWSPGHVAIYIGNGKMIEAQVPGTTICVSPVRVTTYVRYW